MIDLAQEESDVPEQSFLTRDAADTVESQFHAAPLHAATGGETSDTVERSALPMRLGQSQRSGHAFEPLIGSSDAAKLLGNMHVKTLQRYARLGRLPGYQIGGHWYFRASELDTWLYLRINSNCQSVRKS
jgi:excisionase family DNA binding protein